MSSNWSNINNIKRTNNSQDEGYPDIISTTISLPVLDYDICEKHNICTFLFTTVLKKKNKIDSYIPI